MNNLNSGITDLLFKLAGEKYRDLVVIALAWNPLVGALLSKRSKILKFEGSVLFVKISNHVWMQEFVVLRPEILRDLREKTRIKIDNVIYCL